MLAGTFLRGLELVQVSASLVSMVTASVGRKVGINYGGAKNIIGMFKHSALVLADTATLTTLPLVELRSGLGELVTVGVLGAPAIFEHLEAHGATDLPALIAQAIRCKWSLVVADPNDQHGIRAKLNLGHTFGHALEKLSNFSLPHGLAVAVGLHAACELATAINLCSPVLLSRVQATLRRLDLPLGLSGYSAAAVIDAMRADKKRAGGKLHWVLPLDLFVEVSWASAGPHDQTYLTVLGTCGIARLNTLFGFSPLGVRPDYPLDLWQDGAPVLPKIAGATDLL